MAGIQAKAYGNRKAKLNDDDEKIPNRFSLQMSIEDAVLFAQKDKAMVKQVFDAVAEVPEVAEQL